MSIAVDSHYLDDDELSSRKVFDNPEQAAVMNLASDVFVVGIGFEYRESGNIIIHPNQIILYYRFTDEGMIFGYFANPSTGSSMSIPIMAGLYLYSSNFAFARYQPKIYLQCMSHELYINNNFPYEYDYTNTSDSDAIARITKLDQLSVIQVKGFHDLSMTSLICLPYTFFNTYKFDFAHTMYNADGSLKNRAQYYPVMIADGGGLQSQRYYPQPTVVDITQI